MAISTEQKLDFLWKKLGYGKTKTDINSIKAATNEAIPSPLLLTGTDLWTDAYQIPGTKPSADTTVVGLYQDAAGGASSVECIADGTASANRTWKTNLNNWIPPQFGSTYGIKVYLDNANQANPQSTGTELFAAGSGNNDEWFFDYASGVLNFIGTNLPSGIAGKKIYIVGARYIGKLGNRFTALYVDSAEINHLTVDSSEVTLTNIIEAYIDSADIMHAIIDSADITLGKIGTATITNMTADSAHVKTLSADTIYTPQLDVNIVVANQLQGPAELIIDPAATGDNTGNVKILGGLQVEGTTTTVNSTTVSLNDKNLVLADSAPNPAAADGGGITVGGANATLEYKVLGDKWEVNKPLHAPELHADSGEIVSLTATSGTIGSVTIDSATISQISGDSAHIKFIKSDSADIIFGKFDSAKIDFAEVDFIDASYGNVDSVDIGTARINSLQLAGQIPNRFMVSDSLGNMTTVTDAQFGPSLVNLYQGAFQVQSNGNVGIGNQLTVGGVTVERTGMTIPHLTTDKVVITSLSDQHIPFVSNNDSLAQSVNFQFGSKSSQYAPGTFDGLLIGWNPLQDSGTYRFNVDQTSGKVTSYGGAKLGRHNRMAVGQYIQNFPQGDPNSFNRDFFGLEISNDSGNLISTAYKNIFKSPMPTEIAGTGPDSAYVFEIRSFPDPGYEDSTLFAVRRDGSIAIRGNLLKGDNITGFSAGGIFTQNDSNRDAFYYNDPAEYGPTGSKSINHYTFGRVGLGTKTPLYSFSTEGNFASRGEIDSNKLEHLLYRPKYYGYTDDSSRARLAFIPSKAMTRGGFFKDSSFNSNVMGMFSTAFGAETIATGVGTFAAGWASKALGDHAIAIGHNNTTGNTGNKAGVAIGVFNQFDSNFGQADHSIAIGLENRVRGDFATAIGERNTVAGNNAGVFGSKNSIGLYADTTTGTINGANSYAIGNNNEIGKAVSALQFGTNNITSTGASTSIAIGFNHKVRNQQGIALGTNNIINPRGGIAIGQSIELDSAAEYSFAIGLDAGGTTRKTMAPNIMSIRGGNLNIGGDSDHFTSQAYNAEGNLYVAGTLIVEGEIQQVVGAGFSSASPWTDGGQYVTSQLPDGRQYAVEKAAAHQDFDILGPDGFIIEGTQRVITRIDPNIAGRVLDDGEVRHSPATGADSNYPFDSAFFNPVSTDRSIMSYVPKAQVLRIGNFTNNDYLTNAKIGYASTAIGQDNRVAGLYSMAIGKDNDLRRLDSSQYLGQDGSYFRVFGDENIADSFAHHNIVIGSSNRIKGTTNNAFIIGRNNEVSLADSTMIILRQGTHAGDSSLNGTRVLIGKDERLIGNPAVGGGRTDSAFALDVRGDIHLDSPGTIYFGSRNIRQYLGFGEEETKTTTPTTNEQNTTSTGFISRIQSISQKLKITTASNHGFTQGGNLAVNLLGVPSSGTNYISNIGPPNYYFPVILDATSFNLRHDSPNGPFLDYDNGGAENSITRYTTATLVGDDAQIDYTGTQLRELYWTPPAVLPADLDVAGDLRVAGTGPGGTLGLVADSAGVKFTANALSPSTATYEYEMRVDGLKLNGVGVDSHVVLRSGGLFNSEVQNIIDSAYVQLRASNDEFWVNAANSLYYDPATTVKPVQIGLNDNDTTASEKAKYSLHIKPRTTTGAINIKTNGAGIQSNQSPIDIDGSPWPTKAYLTQSGLIDATYVNSVVSVSASTIQNFIDNSYVKSIADSAYIISIASEIANDSSTWQRNGDTLFFGTYPNVANVNVGIGIEDPRAKFEVDGSVRFGTRTGFPNYISPNIAVDSARFGGKLVVRGETVTQDQAFEFHFDSSHLLVDQGGANNKTFAGDAPGASTDITRLILNNPLDSGYFEVNLGGVTDGRDGFLRVFKQNQDPGGSFDDSSTELRQGHYVDLATKYRGDWYFKPISATEVSTQYILVREGAFATSNLVENPPGTGARFGVLDHSLVIKDRFAPTSITFSGNDMDDSALIYNTTHSTISLHDSTLQTFEGANSIHRNPLSGTDSFGGSLRYLNLDNYNFNFIDANSFSVQINDSHSLGDIWQIQDRSPKQTTSMDVSGPVIFRRGTEDNANGAVVIEDSAVIGKLRVDGNSHFRGDSSRFDGNLQVRELRIDSDFLDNNGNTISKGAFRMHLPTQFFIGEKNFDSNVQRVIDSDYIAARTTHLNIWNQGNLAGDGIPGDGLDYDFVNYAGGGAVIIGSPSELQAGDSDTKFIVDRGNVLFKDGGSWDGSGIADPNNWNASYDRIPNLGAGARMMFIPKRGAFRVGAVSDDQWSDDKVGVGSVGIGYNTEASKLSVAIGTNVKSGNRSVYGLNNASERYVRTKATSIGFDINNYIQEGVAVGYDVNHSTSFTGSYGGQTRNVSVGHTINATNGSDAVSVGRNIFQNNGGVVVGKNARAGAHGQGSGVAIGQDVDARYSGTAIGRNVTASSSSTSVGIGISNTATSGGVVIGKSSSTSTSGGIAVGSSVRASTGSGVVVGSSSTVSYGGLVVGSNNSSSGNTIIGTGNTSGGSYYRGAIIGTNNSSTYGGIIIGVGNEANNRSGIAIGYYNYSNDYGIYTIGERNYNNSRSINIFGRQNYNNSGYSTASRDQIFGNYNQYNTYSNVDQSVPYRSIFGHENKYNYSGTIIGNYNEYNSGLNIYGDNNTNNIKGSGGSTYGGAGYIYGRQTIVKDGGMAFGHGNIAEYNGFVFGSGNTSIQEGYSYGSGNRAVLKGYAFGYDNTLLGDSNALGTTEFPMTFGRDNIATNGGIAFGETNTVSNRGIALGGGNVSSGTRSVVIGSAMTVSGNYSVGIGLDDNFSGTVTANNTMAIVGGGVAIGNTSVSGAVSNTLLEVSGNVNVVGPYDYYRHGKQLSSYITDDVINNNYILNIVDSDYVKSAADVAHLRNIMTSQYFFQSNLSNNNLTYAGTGRVGIGRDPVTIPGHNDPMLDVDGNLSLSGEIFINGVRVVPRIDNVDSFVAEYHNDPLYIGTESAEVYFDSAYVILRAQAAIDAGVARVDEQYIEDRIDPLMFLDSNQALILVDNRMDQRQVFQFDGTKRTQLTTAETGGFPVRVGLGTAPDPTSGTDPSVLKVGGNTTIDGQLKINGNNAGIIINGTLFEPTEPGFKLNNLGDLEINPAYGSVDVGIGISGVASAKLDVGGAINATDLKISGQSIDDRFNAAYVQANQLLIDSASIIQLIDSDYVKTIADSNYILSAADSQHIQAYADIFWIRENADSNYIRTAVDSSYIKPIIDQHYIQFNADSAYIRSAADSDYIHTAADSSYLKPIIDQKYIRFNADSNYIRSATDSAYLKPIIDETYVRGHADSEWILSIADSLHVRRIMDSAFVGSITGIGNRSVSFGQYNIEFQNQASTPIGFPNATNNTGNVYVALNDNKPYVSAAGQWNRFPIVDDIPNIVDSAYVQSRQKLLDSEAVLGLIDSDYVLGITAQQIANSLSSGVGGQTVVRAHNYTATQGQTIFEGADLSGITLSYIIGSVIVTVNGVTMTNGVDYTATTGTRITFTSSLDAQDDVTVYSTVHAGGGENIADSSVVSTGTEVIIDQFAHLGKMRSADYIIHMDDSSASGSHSRVSRIHLTYNRSVVNMTEFGVVTTFETKDSDMGTLAADENAGVIRLKFTRSYGRGDVTVKTNKTII